MSKRPRGGTADFVSDAKEGFGILAIQKEKAPGAWGRSPIHVPCDTPDAFLEPIIPPEGDCRPSLLLKVAPLSRKHLSCDLHFPAQPLLTPPFRHEAFAPARSDLRL